MKMKKNSTQPLRYAVVTLIGAALVSIFPFSAAVHAQAGARVTFAITPAIFRAGQPATAELSVTSVSTTPLTLSPGNIFTFLLDNSVGAVTSLGTPISVSSANLLAGDFSASFGGNHNQINLTYNGQSKTFAFGDCLTVKISFVAGAQAGTGKISLSSQFVSAINGNLPFTTVSIVDFANPGLASITHDQSLTGDGTPPTPLGIAAGGVTNADIAIGAVTAPDIAAGQVVKSLNGLEDAISILAGTNVTVTPGPGSLTVSAPNLLSSVAHDATLSGNGSNAAPLGVALQGIGTAQLADFSVTSVKIGTGQVGTTQLANNAVTTAQLANNAVTAAKLAPAQVLKTLNGLTDNVNITTDGNLTVTPTSNSLMISAPKMLTSVLHDATLAGNGTAVAPLSVAVAAPTQQPVAFADRAIIQAGQGSFLVSGPNIYTVPQGQELVIQQLMATVDNSFSTTVFAEVAIDLGFTSEFGIPDGLFLPIVLTEQKCGAFAPFPASGGPDSFAGSQQVTIYLHAGETVQFMGARTGDGVSSFRWYFYGYLVPAP